MQVESGENEDEQQGQGGQEGEDGEEMQQAKKKEKRKDAGHVNMAKKEFILEKFTKALEWAHTITDLETGKENTRYGN